MASSRTCPRVFSPRAVVAMLRPRWQFDRVYAANAVAYDAYMHAQRPAVCLEFTLGERTIAVEVRPADGGPAAATAGGLAISYAGTHDVEAAKALCDQVAADIGVGPHEAGARTRKPSGQIGDRVTHGAAKWRCLHADDAPVPQELLDEVRVQPFDSAHALHPLLRRDMGQYEALYGSRPLLRQVLVDGRPIAGASVRYPAPVAGLVPASAAIYPVPIRVRRRRRTRLHFARLGCVFDADGMPRTVPTPKTLAQGLSVLHARPVLLEWVERKGGPMQAPEWIAHLLRERTIPVTVAPHSLLGVHRIMRRWLPGSDIPADVGMLVHDVSVHGLVFSDIDPDVWDAIASEAKAQCRKGKDETILVARFYEEAVTQACWETWREVEAPALFRRQFETYVPALRSRLRAI